MKRFQKEKGLSRHKEKLKWLQLNQVTDAKIADALSGLLADPDRRSMMSDSGQTLVDGVGRERVIEVLQKQELAGRP